MRLWVEAESIHSVGKAVRVKVSEMTTDVDRKVLSRGVRAINALRNAELEVLKGQRSGKVYRKPGTYGTPSKASKKLIGDYNHKLRGGQLYTASAPGEAPARRTGALRLHWKGDVEARETSRGTSVTAVLESDEKYAYGLENGTSKMAPRPFVEKIKEKAKPEIQKIFSEPYK